MIPTILKPVQGHLDTFRELLDLWAEAGWCKLEPTKSSVAWFGREGTVLLYDWDRLDDLPPFWELVLLGNPPPLLPRALPWTYFARHPRLLEEVRQQPTKRFRERSTKVVFIGRIENPQQGVARAGAGHDWSAVLDLFSCPVMINQQIHYPYTPPRYLEALGNARFGLALPGYGRKCNREIELLAMGTVPLVTPGVDVDNFFEPLVEGVHFFRVERPDDVTRTVGEVDEARWEWMSSACRDWFERNASPRGAWELTTRIIEEVGV